MCFSGVAWPGSTRISACVPRRRQPLRSWASEPGIPPAPSTSSRRTAISPRGAARSVLPLDSFEDQRRLVAAARVQVLARHVLERGVALLARRIPVLAVPTGAEQARERIGRPHADADAVKLRRVERF